MKKFLLLICLIASNFIFSQDAAITTKFIQEGNLYESEDLTSTILIQFKENQKCFVMSYLGKDIYKITYKEWIGYVDSDDLEITEEVMDLYFDFEDQKRINALAKERKRQQKLLEIVKTKEIINQKRINEDEANENSRLEAKHIQDSISAIAKIKAEEQRQLKLREVIRKKEEELEAKRIQDSVIKKRQEEERKLRLQNQIRKKELELEAKHIQDSISAIAKIKAEEQRQSKLREVIRKKEEELEAKRIQDLVIKERQEEERKLRLQNQIRKKELELEAKRIQNANNNSDERLKFRNTCHYLINEYDNYYKEKNIRTEPYDLSEDLDVELHRQGRSLNIFFNLSEDLGCASYLPSNRSNVQVTLENNQVVTFYHSWNMECGEFRFKSKLSKSNMLKLEQSPIKSIKLKGTKNSREIINIDYPEFFIDKLRCLE